ncbi:MAG: asparagine synthase (glutamine-hydrolyzing), partial [Thermomicrobiales bacterium]|nr:asparagine synthase (glutamine-hydrolyzing) [Thermomicrobiales bacterium]
TTSDTEVILSAYRRWGEDCLQHLRGMFAFALWDEQRQLLFCARDRFGIKPFHYTAEDGLFVGASEAKALLPFLRDVETDHEAFRDYLTFQFCLAGKTLFRGIRELPPGHALTVKGGTTQVRRYWDVHYDLDFDHTEQYFQRRLQELIHDSIDMHLRADVPVGAYLSGGLDSSIVASMAARHVGPEFQAFTGKFPNGASYDESHYARAVADHQGFQLHEVEIFPTDFEERIRQVVYHLDYPVAGPGSFPQFLVSALASQHMKVVLGGQGGDEIFGGYARYLVAYFEQCIKAAIDGTMHSGNFIVTYESILPNLTALRNYKPMLREFWRDGLFEDLDHRYFRLVNRAPALGDEIHWDALSSEYSTFATFQSIFRAQNVGKESYFDSMTHFDFKTLLPALLHVEDRMSMAHGLESRVPFVDHPVVEFAATMPSNIKFKDGAMKHVLKSTMSHVLPNEVANRQDKMGFPVPLRDWLRGPLRGFVCDALQTPSARQRELVNNQLVLEKIDTEPEFGRAVWGLLCLELWQQEFHDQASRFKAMIESEEPSCVFS